MADIDSTQTASPNGADNPYVSIRIAVPPILTVPEAAQVSTLSRRTICDAISSGRLRVKRVGRRVIIPRESLERFTGVKLS